jgi:hypothetical protein
VSRFAGTLETQYRIPTVSLVNENIVSFGIGAHTKYNTGMPIRFIGMPYPFTGIKKEMLGAYLEGKDSVSSKPIMKAIVDCLTLPLIAEEKRVGIPSEAAPEPRFLPPDTEDNLQRLFKDKHWTDYNPVILPTPERVAAMLKGTSHKPYKSSLHGGESCHPRCYGGREARISARNPGAVHPGALHGFHYIQREHGFGEWPDTQADRNEFGHWSLWAEQRS